MKLNKLRKHENEFSYRFIISNYQAQRLYEYEGYKSRMTEVFSSFSNKHAHSQ